MQILLIAMLLVVAAIACYYDIQYRIIPNKLTFPAIIVGLTVRYVLGGLPWLIEGLKGAALGFGLLFAMYVTIGGIGEGDIKLLAAFGALGGPHVAFGSFLTGTIISGIYSAAYLFRNKRLGPSLKKLYLWGLKLITTGDATIVTSGETVPYSPFLSLGMLLSVVGRAVFYGFF